MINNTVEEFLSYLNTIHSFAINENAKSTQAIIENIVKLIKYKNYRKNEIVTVNDELMHVKIFLDIIRARFGNKIDYTTNIKDECIHNYIPHYTIMKLIEDSYYNEFSIKENNWKIILNIINNKGMTCISFKDNVHLLKINIS
jgi:two-component system, sensor histidine kinase YesM